MGSGPCVAGSGTGMDWPGVEIAGAVWAAKVGTDGGNAGTSNRVVDGAVGKM